MQRKIIMTKDGSHSIEITGTTGTYHSRFGAIQESLHVFIEAGLKLLFNKYETIHIFEMGFGTGLNALLTFIEAAKNQQKIYYETIELLPLEEKIISSLNYCEEIDRFDLKKIFHLLHSCNWGKETAISPFFVFKKINASLVDYDFQSLFNLIYYDAFAPNAQPELWTKEIFEKLFHQLSENGILVTYCSKGNVRRTLMAAGFGVHKLKGPPGKREILRAVKKDSTGTAPD